MAKRPVLTDVVDMVTAPTIINTNNDNIETAFDNTLSRDGSTPNQMEADLDMNSNNILNTAAIQYAHLDIADGVTAPTATVGRAKIYIDTADGDLKIIFGDGTIKTISVDT